MNEFTVGTLAGAGSLTLDVLFDQNVMSTDVLNITSAIASGTKLSINDFNLEGSIKGNKTSTIISSSSSLANLSYGFANDTKSLLGYVYNYLGNTYTLDMTLFDTIENGLNVVKLGIAVKSEFQGSATISSIKNVAINDLMFEGNPITLKTSAGVNDVAI